MFTSRRDFLKTTGLCLVAPGRAAAPSKPNIIFILADDIGYGDFGCYGAKQVRTPNVDRIAREGIRFTDAHASASVCSPTRYSFLTGQYAFRKPAGNHILSGEAPLSIEDTAVTLPSLLQRAGYTTGLVGKWHLGLGRGSIDWNNEIKPGPLEVGFNYAFYYAATNDRTPCVYIENHHIAGLNPADPIRVSYDAKIGEEPTGREHPELLKLKLREGHADTIVDGISRIGFMSGGKAAWWKDEDMADTFTGKAVSFVERSRARPFFLYFATHDIHQPRWPHQRYRGTTSCGTRCDAIREFDASVGAVLGALDRWKLADNTLVIVSSDNGGAMDDGYESFDVRDANGHLCNGTLRGFKGSLWEGGSREPFIARWPGRIKPGSESAELLCLVDMTATLTAVAGQALPRDAGPDSFNLLPALLGGKSARDHLVLQANGSRALAIRKGPWKLIPPAQLYNLALDSGESNDVASRHSDIVRELSALLEKVRTAGRTRL